MINRRLFTTLSLIAILSSCWQYEKVDCQGQWFYDQDSFSPEQQFWINQSAVRWNSWVGRDVVSVSPGTPSLCYIKIGHVGDGHVGDYSYNTGIIILDLQQLKTNAGEVALRNFEADVMHEMGHGLGFPHIGSQPRDALMNHDMALDFAAIDRTECVALEICSSLIFTEKELLPSILSRK